MLSVAAPISLAPVELFTTLQKTVIVASPAPGRQDAETPSQNTALADVNTDRASALPAKVVSGNPATSTAGAHTSSSATGVVKRSTSKSSSQKQLLDLSVLGLRSSNPGSHEAALEETQNGSGPLYAASGGDVPDTAAVASAVGSVPEALMSLVTSLANEFGDLAAADADLSRGAAGATAPTGSADTVVLAVESAMFLPGDSPAGSDLGVHESRTLVLSAASLVCSSPELLDAAVHADWEAVDGELRQFLARLRGVAGSANGHAPRSLWLAWVGAAGALLVARRASHRSRPLFRGSLNSESSAAGAHGPFPVGPWPQGLS